MIQGRTYEHLLCMYRIYYDTTAASLCYYFEGRYLISAASMVRKQMGLISFAT